MSIDLKMAWRNIWRNPRRTLLTISAVAFACMFLVFMLSFQFGSYDAMINSSVKINTGHIQIQAKDYHDKQSMRLVVSAPEKIGAILSKTRGIAAYTFRAQAFSLVSSLKRTYGVLVIGIVPDREANVSTLKKSIREGRYLSRQDKGQESNQALIGELLAHNLKVGLGDELTLLGQGRDGSIAATVVKIKGIYNTGLDELDRASIHIPLKLFQKIYAMHGSVHQVVAVATSLKNVSYIKKEVSAEIKKISAKNPLRVLDWQELMPGLRQAIEMDLVSGIIYYLILILVVAFSILNTFLMAIFERTREFGVLMAMGTSPGRLTRLLLIESLSMTIIGISSGVLIGCLITWFFQIHGIDVTGSSELLSQYGISGRLYPELSILSAISGPMAVFLITILAALYPALKVRHLSPVEALTYI